MSKYCIFTAIIRVVNRKTSGPPPPRRNLNMPNQRTTFVRCVKCDTVTLMSVRYSFLQFNTAPYRNVLAVADKGGADLASAVYTEIPANDLFILLGYEAFSSSCMSQRYGMVSQLSLQKKLQLSRASCMSPDKQGLIRQFFKNRNSSLLLQGNSKFSGTDTEKNTLN